MKNVQFGKIAFIYIPKENLFFIFKKWFSVLTDWILYCFTGLLNSILPFSSSKNNNIDGITFNQKYSLFFYFTMEWLLYC